VVEHGAHLVGMGGIRPNSATEAEVLHVRVHPATRRQGVGRLLMEGLEARARDLGFEGLHLDTATNQPEAIAFYTALGYTPAGTESNPNWTWTLPVLHQVALISGTRTGSWRPTLWASRRTAPADRRLSRRRDRWRRGSRRTALIRYAFAGFPRAVRQGRPRGR